MCLCDEKVDALPHQVRQGARLFQYPASRSPSGVGQFRRPWPSCDHRRRSRPCRSW
jgi:hypothetical protein